MDDRRFDDLTKQVASSSSRRYFLRSLAVAAAGVGFSLKGPQALAAQPVPKCQPLGHKCSANVQCCSRYCDKNGKQCVCPPDIEIACNNRCVALCHEVGNPCQASLCDPATGRCVKVNNDGAPCEDGDPCTLGDTCQGGTCQPGRVKTCDNECLECRRSDGTCVPVANGTPCDDGNPCTQNDTCQAGVCTPGAQKTCPPSTDPCKVSVCDPATGDCVSENAPNDTPCEDGDLCTVGDTCQNGTCRPGSPKTCPPSTDPCKVSVCVPATGDCVSENAPNDTPCEDGDPCTLGDTCQNGTCRPGSPKTCPPSTDPCKVSVCNPVTGQCEATQNAPSGTPCEDGNPCTVGDTCQNGTCRPGQPLSGTPCGGTGSGRVCCAGQCCQGGRICVGGSCVKP